jgi:hypothetical protein
MGAWPKAKLHNHILLRTHSLKQGTDHWNFRYRIEQAPFRTQRAERIFQESKA